MLKLLIEAYVERWRARKALRILAKQEWSVEFLQALLVRASKVQKQQLELIVTGPGGVSFKLITPEAESMVGAYRDDSIFNHLNDEIRVNQFIEQLNRNGK